MNIYKIWQKWLHVLRQAVFAPGYHLHSAEMAVVVVCTFLVKLAEKLAVRLAVKLAVNFACTKSGSKSGTKTGSEK